MKNQWISLKKIMHIIIYIIFIAIITIYTFTIQQSDFYTWLYKFSLIAIISLIFQLTLFKIEGIPMFNMTTLFIIMTYLFHFGQIFLNGLFRNYRFQGFNFILIVDPESYIYISMFCLFSVLSVGLGVILSSKGKIQISSANTERQITNEFKDNMHMYRSIGKILALFFFPIRLFTDLKRVLVSLSHGYLQTFNAVGTGSGILDTLGYLSFVGIALIIMGYSNEKKKAFKIYAVVSLYLVVTMISGGRGMQITLLLMFLYLEHRLIYKIRFKNLAIILICGYLFLGIVNTIVQVRGQTDVTFLNLWNIYIDALGNSPVLKLIEELGGTSYTPYLAYQKLSSGFEPRFGSTYLKSFAVVFPNIGGIFSKLNSEAYFVKMLSGSALGGSYIGELYYNFKWFGLIFAIIIGFFINRISNYIDYYITTKKFLKVAYLLPLFTYSLWWIRDYFGSVLRPLVWGSVIIWIIYQITNDFSYRKGVDKITQEGMKKND